MLRWKQRRREAVLAGEVQTLTGLISERGVYLPKNQYEKGLQRKQGLRYKLCF